MESLKFNSRLNNSFLCSTLKKNQNQKIQLQIKLILIKTSFFTSFDKWSYQQQQKKTNIRNQYLFETNLKRFKMNFAEIYTYKLNFQILNLKLQYVFIISI